MISRELALGLKKSGVTWMPSVGDRFVVPNRDMDNDVFTISDMVVEAHDLPTGRVLAFNGTTEWALDSVAQRDVVWLPREEQLRALLADAFVSMHATAGGFAVVVDHDGRKERHPDTDVECAYARAVLSLRDSQRPDPAGQRGGHVTSP